MSYWRGGKNECGDCDNGCYQIKTIAVSSDSNRTEKLAAEKWIEFKENMVENLHR